MTRRLLRRPRATVTEEESVWISFSDLMTALLTVFMLAAVALVYTLTQEQDAAARARHEAEAANARNATFNSVLNSLGTGEQVRSDMVTQIRERLAQRGIRVEVDQAGSVIRIPVDLLGFDSGSSDIRPQHQTSALIIGSVVSQVLLENNRYRQLDTVFVEGHTDNVPIDGVHGGNWGLSADRAISLWRLWETRLPNHLDALTGHTGERLFSVSGYADTRPIVVDQKSERARAANRRIDIRFTEHRLSDAELKRIRAAADAGGS